LMAVNEAAGSTSMLANLTWREYRWFFSWHIFFMFYNPWCLERINVLVQKEKNEWFS
jgi:hypothetical protein